MATLANAYVQIIPSAEGIQAGTIGTITNQLSGADAASSKWEQSLNSIANIMKANFAGQMLTTVANGIKSIGSAMQGAVSGALGLATAAGHAADDLLTLSSQTHISAQSLQEWSYASRFIDTSVESITGSMTKLTRNMSSSSAETSAAMRKLHVSFKQGGKLRETEDVFWDIIDALGQIPNQAERDALAMTLLGKSAQELNPLIEAGSSAFRGMGAEAAQMGTVLSSETLSALGSFDDSMQRLDATSQAFKNVIGAQLVPAFQPLIDAASSAAGEMARLFQDGIDAGDISQIVATVKESFGSAFSTLGEVIREALPVILEALTEIFNEISSFCQTELPGVMEEIGSFLSSVGAVIAPVLAPVGEAIVSAIGSAIMGALGSVDWAEVLLGVAEALISGIVMLVGAIVLKLAEMLPEILEQILAMIGAIVEAVAGAIAEQANKFVQIAGQWMQGIVSGIQSGIDGIITAVMSIPETIIQSLGAAVNQFVELGMNMIQGIIEGIQRRIQDITSSIVNGVKGAIDAAKGFLGIASPSKLFRDEIGMNIAAGVAEGINKGAGLVETAQANAFAVNRRALEDGAALAQNAYEQTRMRENGDISSASGSSEGFVQNVTINSPTALSPYETARQTRNATRNMVLSMTTGG